MIRSASVKDTIVDLYRNKYSNATYQHFTELLQEFEHISISEAVVRKTLMNQYLLSPQATKKTKKDVRELLEEKKKAASNPREEKRLQSLIVDIENAHARTTPLCFFYFSFKDPSIKPCVKFIPPMSHPWKKASFEQFKRKQAHRAELMTGS